MFTRIPDRYDRVNRALSFGRDQHWRAAVMHRLPPGLILDVGAGTGTADAVAEGRRLVHLDPSVQMLSRNPGSSRVVAQGERLPFADGSFDGAFSAFVFRNLDSVPATLAEVHRVLRPGGLLGVVDATRPSGWRGSLHRLGTSVSLALAGALTGAWDEYRYLHHSLDKLPPPEILLAGGPFSVDEVWRMGIMGFVYGAVLRRD